jgi:monofunctional biosynthetic peptidoglycan transglycosylase
MLFYGYFQWTIPDVAYLKTKNPRTTALIEQRKTEYKQAGKRFRLRQHWVSFQEIPDLMKKAIRITEDASFYKHQGIDFHELEMSIKENLEEGQFKRGASTITQQLAKNLFLSTDKSILRKIREYFITRALEDQLTKNRIFHIYLNIIELGPGIFGVSAAARYYFRKPLGLLSHEEIIRLTAIIPRPLSVRADGNQSWLRWKCRWICDKLLLYQYISPEEHQVLNEVFE